MNPLPTRVRSTERDRGERTLHWQSDDIHPYALLDQTWLLRAVPGHGAFTQRVNRSFVPIGKVRHHDSLPAALESLGWEIIR